VKKEVFAVAKDRNGLIMCDAQLEYVFDFKLDDYVFVACMMLKYDKNLSDVRENIVPNLVSEDEFWRNYFYLIELSKKSLGLPTRLTQLVSTSEKQKRIQVQETLLKESRMQVEAREKGIDIADLDNQIKQQNQASANYAGKRTDTTEHLDDDSGIEMTQL
jgi:outer membrane lipoprotein-sorting protein